MSPDSTNSGLFDVVFFGILHPGKDKEVALENLAKLFKTQADKLRPLFAGGRKVIKGKVTEEIAEKYINALTNVGLVVNIEEYSNDANTPEPKSATDSEKPTDTSTDSVTEALTIAEVGADVLVNPAEKEIQEIDDFSFLTMAEVGADVLEHPVKVKPQVIGDISDIKLEDES